jgi:hypothetical protein
LKRKDVEFFDFVAPDLDFVAPALDFVARDLDIVAPGLEIGPSEPITSGERRY